MKRLLFDLETNGLMDAVSVVHCAVVVDMDTAETTLFRPGQHDELMALLDTATELWGHNIIGYDLKVLAKLYGYAPKAGVCIRDTLVCCYLAWPDMATLDYTNTARNRYTFPNMSMKFIGSHSLDAWGYRLKYNKGDYGKKVDAWDVFTEEMLAYCEQDVMLTLKLYQTIKDKNLSQHSMELEHEFATYIDEMTTYGVLFDVPLAERVCGVVDRTCNRWFASIIKSIPDVVTDTIFTPKRDNKTKGYLKGVAVTRTACVPFNPNSANHIIDHFQAVFGWVPTIFAKPTKANRNNPAYKPSPTVGYEVLSKLPYHGAFGIATYRLLGDRLGLIKKEKQSLLHCVKPDGRIHGRVFHNGTNTGRCRHTSPNLGNIPSTRSKLGTWLRRFFIVPEGSKLIGVDFDGLEMRCLAEALWPYDEGAFYRKAFFGDKAAGTDAHSLNMVAFCKATTALVAQVDNAEAIDRDRAKLIFYALLYGSGAEALGLSAFGVMCGEAAWRKRVGSALKKAVYSNTEGLKELEKALKADLEARREAGDFQALTMPDGRETPVRADYAALNTYLQCLGALIAKAACVDFRRRCREKGVWLNGVAPVLMVHDEVQLEVRDEYVEWVKANIAESFLSAGRSMSLNVETPGSVSVGTNWLETH